MKHADFHAETPDRRANVRGPKKRSYLNDFQRTADGGYRYGGDHYALRTGARGALLRKDGILSCGAFLCVLAAGAVGSAGLDRCFYVLLPYLGELGCCGALVWAFGRFLFADKPLRAYVYQAAVYSVPRRAAAAAIFSAARLAGQTVFLALNGTSDAALPVAAEFALGALAAAFALALRVTFKKAVWEKIEPKTE